VHALPVIVVAAAAAGVIALVRTTLCRERRFGRCGVLVRCPLSGELERCVVRTDPDSGRIAAIEHCNAFSDPNHVVCRKPCAKLLNLGRTR